MLPISNSDPCKHYKTQYLASKASLMETQIHIKNLIREVEYLSLVSLSNDSFAGNVWQEAYTLRTVHDTLAYRQNIKAVAKQTWKDCEKGLFKPQV